MEEMEGERGEKNYFKIKKKRKFMAILIRYRGYQYFLFGNFLGNFPEYEKGYCTVTYLFNVLLTIFESWFIATNNVRYKLFEPNKDIFFRFVFDFAFYQSDSWMMIKVEFLFVGNKDDLDQISKICSDFLEITGKK